MPAIQIKDASGANQTVYIPGSTAGTPISITSNLSNSQQLVGTSANRYLITVHNATDKDAYLLMGTGSATTTGNYHYVVFSGQQIEIVGWTGAIQVIAESGATGRINAAEIS
jgi:hypothetical protein